MIGSGTGWPPFILSTRVVEGLHAAGLGGFTAYPIDITELTGSRLKFDTSPGYFWLQIHGLIDLDLDASGIRVENPCPVCGRGDGRTRPTGLVPISKSWDGSAIFMARNFPSNYVYCSEAILELARQHRWTNFGFKVMGISDSVQLYWEGIDYLGSKWPPDWYPPGYSP